MRRAPRRRSPRASRQEALWAYALIAPTMLGLGVFYLGPMLLTFYYSFRDWGDFGDSVWTGLDNYVNLFDADFGRAFLNTIVYTVIVTLLGIPVATIVAGMLNTPQLRLRTAYRVIYFLPVVTLPAAIGILWRWVYAGDYGIVNYLLSLVGIDGPAWVADPRIALYAVAFVGIWMTLGYNVVIILAGMQEVPKSYYEAAMVDGAGPITRFWRITVPLITPTLFFVTVLTVIRALQVFDIVYLMIPRNSPAFESTRPIVYFFYQSAFVENEKGFAAAVAFVLFVLIAALTAVQFRLQRRWVHR
jgi:multiple sugar transport system permease protein